MWRLVNLRRYHNRDWPRKLFKSAISELGEDIMVENFFVKFTRFEIKAKDIERQGPYLNIKPHTFLKTYAKYYESYLEFEKQFGFKNEIEEAILTKRKISV